MDKERSLRKMFNQEFLKIGQIDPEHFNKVDFKTLQQTADRDWQASLKGGIEKYKLNRLQ